MSIIDNGDTMGHIYLNPQGGGTATVDNPNPNDGERFIIYIIPNIGMEVDDVRAFDSYDNPVAIPVATTITMVFNDAWGNLYVDIYFRAIGPTPPTPTNIPIWLLFKIRDGNINGR